MTMTDFYHLALLPLLALAAAYWNGQGRANLCIKLLFGAAFIWGALVAAIDWVQP